jgi:hypothetical protein
MEKDKQKLPQEFQSNQKIEGSGNQEDVAEQNDIQSDSVFIIGGGDPNLSPDAGKPMI